MNLFHAVLLTLALTNSADVYTTVACPQPCTEQNPLNANPLTHRRLYLTEVSAGTAAELVALEKLHATHPKLATLLTVSLSAFESSLIASNLHSWRVVGR